jgi:hypothetical protein
MPETMTGFVLRLQVVIMPTNELFYLETIDFVEGSLEIQSFIRPAKLFTASESLFQRQIGQISKAKLKETTQILVALLNPEVA